MKIYSIPCERMFWSPVLARAGPVKARSGPLEIMPRPGEVLVEQGVIPSRWSGGLATGPFSASGSLVVSRSGKREGLHAGLGDIEGHLAVVQRAAGVEPKGVQHS